MSKLVRAAIPSDLDALIALSHRTIRACYPPMLGKEAVDAFLDSGAADRFVAENMGRCWVITRDGAIAGYSVCRDNVIDLMMIDHPFHRQGLGIVLLRHVEQLLFQSFDDLRLDSFERNDSANAFYRKNGWREASRYFDQNSGVQKIVFQKRAPRAGPFTD
jgi:GNAT superfamily N-acetyltransferase